jgi:thioredoxin-dependent peroxiredoxin
MLKIGDKAPAFRLKNDAGNDVALSDYQGKRVVLFFYPKANTSG